ncbi:MAG: HEPN domain-containing protein [Pseudomonadota bacterium]
MMHVTLARSYMEKAIKRRRVLEVLLEEDAFSDVVREAQEMVELALKGMLRQVGIDPPKWHDVGPLLIDHAELFPTLSGSDLQQLAAISKWLRKEQEFAFYGDIDFIPTEEYTLADAERAIHDALFVVEAARRVILPDE